MERVKTLREERFPFALAPMLLLLGLRAVLGGRRRRRP